MSAFTITMLYAITIGIGFGIGYFFNKDNLKLWRICVGFLVGFIVSWLGGVIIWVLVFMSNDIPTAMITGMAKSFLVALVGAGMGVYYGRRQAKRQDPNHTYRSTAGATSVKPTYSTTSRDSSIVSKIPQAKFPEVTQVMSSTQPTANPIPSVASESSQQSIDEIEDRLYAQIAHEVETNTVDKGIWTKAFAQTGGDEKQTHVIYIKTRFERLMAVEISRLDTIRQEQEEAARLAAPPDPEEAARLAEEERNRAERRRLVQW